MTSSKLISFDAGVAAASELVFLARSDPGVLFGAATLSGLSFAHANRADSSGNVPARSDKHASWIRKPARLESRAVLFTTCPAAVSDAGVTAIGFPWLGRVPRHSKSSEPRPKSTSIQATVNPFGFAVCNRPEPKAQSIQCSMVKQSKSERVKYSKPKD